MKSPGASGADAPSSVAKTQQATHAQQAQVIQQSQSVQMSQKVSHISKLDKLNIQKVDQNISGKGMDPVGQKSGVDKGNSAIMGTVAEIEKGGVNLDKLINGGFSGKSFSNSELLSMQAGMYKYTQELDLCSKVVEKATSGLKDTLKTQV